MATTLRAEVLRELFGNTLDDVDVSLKNSFDEMSLEKFDECLRNVEWDNFNVFQLRDFNTKVKNLIISTKIDKKSPFNALALAVSLKLEEMERGRPVEEQFPFLRDDVNSLLRLSFSQQKSIQNSINYEKNKADELEYLVSRELCVSLEREGWDVDTNVLSKGGKIYKSNGDELVQWDSSLAAVKDIHKRLILVDTKDTPHESHIYGSPNDKKGLNRSLKSRALRTVEYLQQLTPNDDIGFKEAYKRQMRSLFPYKDYKKVIVFASRFIRDGVKEEMEKLSRDEDICNLGIDIWCCELSHGAIITTFS